MLIRIRSSLDHAWSLIVHGNASEALPLCTKALTMLKGGKPDAQYPPFSISLAWSVYGCALHDLDRLGEALDAHQKACNISRSIREQESHLFLLSHGALATTLHKMGRQSEAANVWRELVDARRRIHRAPHRAAEAAVNTASEPLKKQLFCGAAWLVLDLAGRSAEASAIKREVSSLQPVAIAELWPRVFIVVPKARLRLEIGRTRSPRARNPSNNSDVSSMRAPMSIALM
ncbi:hypothetical protein BS47DRAFT_739893 [Hydnum rufescens UP504]|uniref:Tetratricopeptide repeat protein n=1 Tax=Hydnum rufescens UP504 TaxID=1448309 RepID=A0A9P6B102_9AGAM|nr:hypothetical protein BS47DRAFT_739893 [Hydnum rufescens UP504]